MMEPSAERSAPAGLAEDVRRGLARDPKRLQSRYFYDDLGSCLFEAICRLPWYSVTRAEQRLLEREAATIAAACRSPLALIELGCGSGEKLAVLASAVGHDVRAHLIDISPAAIELSERTLGGLPHVSVVAHRTAYDEGLREAAAERRPGEALLILFLGSNLGNFDPPAADAFLRRLRSALRPGDRLLLGADLVKPEAELRLAYDDPLGVTAAFNKNLLARLNRELGAEFDLNAFDHRVVWNPDASRIEMHLESRRRQVVRIPGAGCEVTLGAGERIWTESSYKYTPSGIVDLAGRAGFRRHAQWIDPEAGFALTLLALRFS